jgi:hypothetical protein
VNARGAPQWVLLAHLMNEFAQLTTDRGPSWPSAGSPAPIGAKACPVPSQYRLGLYDPGQPEQAWPNPAHPNQQRPVAPMQPRTMRCTPKRDVELVTKKEISSCRRGLNRSAMNIASRWRMTSIE